MLQVAAAIGVCRGEERGGVAIGIECQQLEMKFVVQFRSLSLLFLSLSVATADQMCKQRINFESQDTVWQTHMHTSTHTYMHRDKYTHT